MFSLTVAVSSGLSVDVVCVCPSLHKQRVVPYSRRAFVERNHPLHEHSWAVLPVLQFFVTLTFPLVLLTEQSVLFILI